MVKRFSAIAILFLCTTTIYSLDVAEDLAPFVNKKPFTACWRTARRESDDSYKIRLQEDQYTLYESQEDFFVRTKKNRDTLDKFPSDTSRLRYPSIIEYNRGHQAYYPIEYFLEIVRRDRYENVKRILDLDPALVNGFKDYHPLKAIFLTMRKNGLRGLNDDCLDLIDLFLRSDDIDLEAPFPSHIGLGLGEDQDKGFENCSPMDYFAEAEKAFNAKRVTDYMVTSAECELILRKLQDARDRINTRKWQPAQVKPTIQPSNRHWLFSNTFFWCSTVTLFGFGFYWLKNNDFRLPNLRNSFTKLR